MTATLPSRPLAQPAADGEPRPARRAGDTRGLEVRGVPAYLVCFLLFLPANMFSGNARKIFPIGPDRLLLAAGLTLLVLDPRPWAAVRVRWRRVHWLFVVFAAFAAVSAAISGTLSSSFGIFALLDRVIVPFVLFSLAPVVFSDLRSRDLLIKTLVVIGIYLGLTAVFELIGPHALVFPRYILDPAVGIQFGRARGPFVESEADGLTMAACTFAAGVGVTRFPGVWRTLAVLTCLAGACGILLTLTRSVWIGTTLGVVLIGLAAPRLRRRLPAALILGTLAVLAALQFVPGLRERAFQRADSQGPLYDRYNTNAAALRIVEARPLTGVGWERFIDVVPDWVRQAPTYPITNINLEVHNVFLGRAAELGLVGGGLFVLCVIAGPVAAFVRRAPAGDLTAWRAVALGIFCTWVVAANSSPLPYPLPNALLWMVAGIASTAHISRPGPARVGLPAVPLA